MKKRILTALLLLTSYSYATTTVSGHLSTLGTGSATSSSGSFVRFYLRGCRGNQPRITGTGAIAPQQSGNNVFYVDLAADGSGNVSGTIYSTRDAAGVGNGDIECGGSYTAVWYGMVVYSNGVAGPEVPVHAKSGATLDPSNVAAISTPAVSTGATGDTTYLQLSGGNSPVTGPVSFKAINGIRFADQYGLLGDGTTDNTAAFNTLISAMCSAGDRELYFKPGQYRFASKPNAIGCGIWLKGAGNGSTIQYETSLIDDYTESTATNGFLTWDGSYSSNAGTGGGIENMTIYKKTNNGGTAIKVTGSADANRAGFFTIRDVIVSASGGATWNKGLIVDGSCCTTSGGQGVRDIYIENFWPAVMSDGDTSILFNNAVQVFWFGGEVFPASGGGSTGLTVTGAGAGTSASTNVFLDSVYFVGNIAIDYVSTFQTANVYVGGNFTSTANSNGCRLGGQIGGTITNTGNCELMTQTQWTTGASTLFKGTTNQFNNAVGIGGPTSGAAGLYVTGTPFSGTQQFGASMNATFSHQATVLASSFSSAPATENYSFTLPNLYGYYAGAGTKGAASTITNFIGHGCANNLSMGSTNYCFHSGTGNNSYFASAQIDSLQISSTGSSLTWFKLATHSALDLASVANAACSADNTETVTGAALGDSCSVAAGSALETGGFFRCAVTATDTVKWQLCNLSGGAIDRASDTYTIRVIR